MELVSEQETLVDLYKKAAAAAKNREEELKIKTEAVMKRLEKDKSMLKQLQESSGQNSYLSWLESTEDAFIEQLKLLKTYKQSSIKPSRSTLKADLTFRRHGKRINKPFLASNSKGYNDCIIFSTTTCSYQ